ncbi:MAG: hypothetical protein U0V02_14710 [Anaerolineales bacterium]
MKQNKLYVLFAVLALVVSTLACEFNASTANISDAYLARDEQGANRTTVFAQDEIFYCIIQLANAPDDTTVKVVWYAVNAQNTDPNLLIDQVEATSGDGIIPFNLTNNGSWPLGTYKAEIYLNGMLDRTLDFEVQ